MPVVIRGPIFISKRVIKSTEVVIPKQSLQQKNAHNYLSYICPEKYHPVTRISLRKREKTNVQRRRLDHYTYLQVKRSIVRTILKMSQVAE